MSYRFLSQLNGTLPGGKCFGLKVLFDIGNCQLSHQRHVPYVVPGPAFSHTPLFTSLGRIVPD